MDNDILNKFSDTVQSIHAAALQPGAWSQVMHNIACLQRASRALLFTPVTAPQEGGFVMAHEVPESFIIEWGSRYLPHDLWTSEGLRRDMAVEGNVMLSVELVPDEHLVQSVFYREFLSRLDIRRMCTGVVFEGRQPQLPFTVCAVYRGNHSLDFNETNRTLHSLLVRHLSQALGAMLQLRDKEFQLATSLQALDRLHAAVILLGHRGHVLFANHNALGLLGRDLGLSLRTGHPLCDGIGWLQARDHRSQALLEAHIQAALVNDPLRPAHFAQGMRIAGTGGQPGLVLQIVPASEQQPLWGSLQPGALAFVTDLQAAPMLDCALLQRLYAISSAECRVAQALLQGQTIQEIAQHLRLSENTVKTHLKQLFFKTDTHRQPQLVRLLLGLVH